LSRKFLVLDSEYHDWKGCEDDIEDLIDPFLIEDLPTESRVESKPELRHHEKYILVEDVAN
jgi:hypothetical protein